jgi:hypothetical protein
MGKQAKEPDGFEEAATLKENVAIGKIVRAITGLADEDFAKLHPRGQRRFAAMFDEYAKGLNARLSTGKTDSSKVRTDASEPMSDQEACDFERTKITFGKYAGQNIYDVPIGYLEWLSDQPDDYKRTIRRYLNSPRVRRLIDTDHSLTEMGYRDDVDHA